MNQKPTIYFDEQCRLCHASVRFIRARDPHERYAFEPLQSVIGQQVARQAGLDPDQPGSLVLAESGNVYTRSDGALRIAAGLRFPWPGLKVLRILPRRLRDHLYDWVARNRYRWFGTVPPASAHGGQSEMLEEHRGHAEEKEKAAQVRNGRDNRA